MLRFPRHASGTVPNYTANLILYNYIKCNKLTVQRPVMICPKIKYSSDPQLVPIYSCLSLTT